MTAGELATEVGLRLLGAFYAFTAPFVLRVAATSRFLSLALAALSSADPQEERAETIRTAYLCVNAVLIGVGGILLMARAELAAPVFVMAALSYGLYLFWIAPRYLDPHDPPEEPGRSRTRNAFFVYVVATVVVLSARLEGALLPLDALSAPAIGLCALLLAALAGYGLWLFKPWGPTPAAHRDFFHEEDIDPDEADTQVPWSPSRNVVLTPSWIQGGLIDADTGNHCFGIEGVDLPPAVWEQIAEWNALFRRVADPDDPMRCALRGQSELEEIEAAGRPVYELLVEYLSADRVAFEPEPRPAGPVDFPSAIKVMIDHHCSPLWHDGGEDIGPIGPDQLGISWRLARDLDDWAWDFDSAVDPDDPGAGPRWDADKFDAHDRQGAALSARLSDELARTGRGDIPVRFVGHSAAFASTAVE